METKPITRSLRAITNGDLWAAARGLGMYRMTRDELRQLIAEHEPLDAFASKVIVEAARQVLATKPREC